MMTTTPRTLFSVGTAPVQTITGVYAGVVYNTNDPLRQNRIQVQVPQVLGVSVSNWATPVGQPSGGAVPSVSSQVLVAFTGGDRNYPVYFPLAWVTSIPVPLQLTASTITTVLGIEKTADTNERFTIDTNGKLQWGSGSSGTDTNLYRFSSGVLKTDGTFNSTTLNTTTLNATTVGATTGNITSVFATTVNFADGSAPSTPVSSSTIYSSSGQQKYISSDTNTYNTGSLRQVISPRAQTINTTGTGQAITGLSASVAIGTYIVTGRFWMQWNAAAGNPGILFTGPTISQYDIAGSSHQQSTGSVTNVNNWLAANTVNGSGYNTGGVQITATMTGAGGNFLCEFWGMFVFTASGTLNLAANTSNGADTWIMEAGFWEVKPVT